ncbi:MAG: translation elongation factor Ts [Bacteroidetes bacterium]|nr:translation elongation factor Ts [Bacteroidota bacterium]MBU1113675.1 translation elongation factor Ts [Bacteroidota bacterium]MBU1799106.1 translation elongation factor Ts [Bacteroidota bacterium]
MAITALQVKELRDKTGAGMMDCKKALVESDGDLVKAIENLRKKGASVAAKRADRDAKEGTVLTKVLDGGKTGIILEINCETDFVANSDDFVNFSNFILDVVATNKPSNLDELLASELKGKKVDIELTNIIGKIGEKIEVSRFKLQTIENATFVDYIHAGSKLGVLLQVENTAGVDSEKVLPTFKDIAMQAAAMKPLYLVREEIPTSVIEKEKEIYKEVLRKEGKPEQMLDKIADGKINKFFQEVCLTEQIYVKDNSKSVKDVIAGFNKENSSDVKLTAFYRYHVVDENK